MAVAPHHLAAQSAVGVLHEGGNAIEAMVAAAATIAVVYPHMNSIGGDAFWLLHAPATGVRALDACGAAAGAASIDGYIARGYRDAIPFRGGVAALTVAGTVSGWDAALRLSQEALGGRLPLSRLLEDAIEYAERGHPVTASQEANTAAKRDELLAAPGFASVFLAQGAIPRAGSLFRQPQLARTLRHLARSGLADFYRGELAHAIVDDLARAGSPLALTDLEAQQARWCAPLALEHRDGVVYNLPPPTQGLVSLLILGMLDRVRSKYDDPIGAAYVHHAVEAAKLAFRIRDAVITDPAHVPQDPIAFLAAERLDALAARIDGARAAPWGAGAPPADTVWMGAVDERGTAVSFIQSIYHEFGSGVVLPQSGITWQNRGCSFSLSPGALNALAPGRKPFHTLNPALARLNDGRTLVYGTMGGDGQPQTQSAVFSRIVSFGMNPQQAIDAPRWLLGRTWGRPSDTLKLEPRFPAETIETLRRLGHGLELLADYDETVGHAGAIVRHADGLLEGGADPRSDGAVAAW